MNRQALRKLNGMGNVVVKVKCTNCQNVFSVRRSRIGVKKRCPKCRCPFVPAEHVVAKQ